MFQLDSGLCDGLWHVVMVEHNRLEVTMALDIETRVTKVALGMETNTHMEFVVIKPEVDIVDNVLSLNLNRSQSMRFTFSLETFSLLLMHRMQFAI